MVWKKMVAKQFRKPSGPLGHFAARFMEKNNLAYYGRVVELLEIQDTDRVLEVGCGAGLAIKLLLTQNAGCRVWGLDFSRLMLKKAQKNNREALAQGRVQLFAGDFSTHDFGAQKFNKIFLINVIYFWENLGPNLSKLHELLEPHGRVAIYMSSPERLNTIPFAVNGVFNKRPAETVMAELKNAGFSRVAQNVAEKDGKKTHYIRADK